MNIHALLDTYGRTCCPSHPSLLVTHPFRSYALRRLLDGHDGGQRESGSYVGEDAPEDLTLGLGGSVVGRGEQREAEEEREKRGVEGGVVVDAARVAGG